ncbi:patj homolog isoform X1 [Drosophila pseudoobscura]|uniref:Patj homolog isoform X1 n=1 Tax=Drosophila pseudoobscura pseudoobscura TaxID=46245 RepID=A0A6I8VAM1_DROPS|nr:patj homolog isoform X1 [Drosophila pseudoobscura]
MVLSTEWSQVEVIDLINDGNGLGFILVGGRSTGVVIKALTPGGVAERDGRLQLGDHLLQIGEVNLRGFSSEQVATVLRQTGAQVRLIVARPVEPTAIDYQTLASHAPIIPTKLLSDPEELSRHLFQNPSFSTAAAAAAAAGSVDVANLVGLVRGGPTDGSELATAEPLGLGHLQLGELTELADFPLPPIPPHMIGSHSSSSMEANGRQCPRDLDIVPFSILSPPPRPALQLALEPRWRTRDRDGQEEEDDQHIETVIAGKLLADEEDEEGDGDGDDSASASPSYMDSPETETYVVELHKNVYGLGITVAGYVCEEEDLSGIFVKSIIEGSAAETSGQIQINDRIVAVDGRSLSGVTNHQAVELLRNTDIEVHLTLERFLRGRKFEHLQVALTEIKGRPAPCTVDNDGDGDGDGQSQLSMPGSPSIATLSWLPPKSLDADSIATEGEAEGEAGAADDEPLELADLPSRDTVESNMSHVLDRSDHSGPRPAKSPNLVPSTPPPSTLTNGQLVRSRGHGRMAADDSGNDTDEQCPEPEPERDLETDADPAQSRTPTNELDGAAIGVKGGAAVVKADRVEKAASPSAASLRVAWKSEFPDSEILVAEINKLSGLGISLEGTVDVECGIEKRPHHYIRSILEDGPVGRQGILRPGDELLQVNEHKLQGLRHIDVVKILKELPARVKLVCARGTRVPSVINTSQNAEAFETRSLLPGGHQSLQNLLSKAQSESSLYTSSTATLTEAAGGAGNGSHQRSKSLENVSGLALWSCEVTAIDIEKTEQGFGFSILDYQDPLDSEGSVIVIRGLIRGGAAEATNEIYPGDRLISVGDHLLQGLELDEAVSILKAMPPGLTRIGICRPLSTSDSNSNIASPLGDSAST